MAIVVMRNFFCNVGQPNSTQLAEDVVAFVEAHYELSTRRKAQLQRTAALAAGSLTTYVCAATCIHLTKLGGTE